MFHESCVIKNGASGIYGHSSPLSLWEREVLFLLPTAKPEEPKKLPISAVVP